MKHLNRGGISYLKVVARVAAEAAAVGVVGAAQGSLGDGGLSRPVVAVDRVPDDVAVSQDVTVFLFSCCRGE